jgi:uncharacterized membrane protein
MPEPATPAPRLTSIDLLRGIVMVIMMLDHTRDFVHNAALQFDPTDPTRTNVVLYFTRWITHFCAPVFVFLAGTSAYLQYARGKGKADLSRFLITRGLWLILLEFTVVRAGALFNFDPTFLGFVQVIWVIGVSMIVLALLIHLPLWVIGLCGVTMIGLHNLLDKIRVDSWQGPEHPVPSLLAKLWMLLHQPFEVFPVAGWPSPVLLVIYPLVPWIGVMAVGYVFGSLYQKDALSRRKALVLVGIIAITLFLLVRGMNVYGDPAPWSAQKNFLFTILSFLNTTKYPPSLLFLLMTLGPATLLLAWFESTTAQPGANNLSERLQHALVTFGRVPLFFYLLQWPTAHLISLFLHLTFGKPVQWLFQTPIGWQGAPPGVGFNLGVVYLCWVVGILLLYPLCKWFAGLKQRRGDWWLSYL